MSLIACDLAGSSSLAGEPGEPGEGVGEAGGVVAVGSPAFPVGTCSLAENPLDPWQVGSVDPSGRAVAIICVFSYLLKPFEAKVA